MEIAQRKPQKAKVGDGGLTFLGYRLKNPT